MMRSISRDVARCYDLAVLRGWIGIVGLLLMQVGTKEPLAPSSVAEAINNSAKYDERTLTLKGALLPNVHGPFLEGKGCEVRFGG